jgi:hypothetical protein
VGSLHGLQFRECICSMPAASPLVRWPSSWLVLQPLLLMVVLRGKLAAAAAAVAAVAAGGT